MIDPLGLPKAELHVHVEGTLEPELMFRLGQRNDVSLPYRDVSSVKEAYRFTDLQSFLDLYYRACTVLVQEEDFYELTFTYLERAAAQGVRHTELFFDPQTHTVRGVNLGTVIGGIDRALSEGLSQLGISSKLILCFLRDRSQEDALRTFEAALDYRDRFVGVGLDSAETGNPPEKFKDVFAAAREEGLHLVAHAGEEGPPKYIWQALDVLGVERVDHGVACLRDARLVERLATDQIPLTVCPLSNVRLKVIDSIGSHPLPELLVRGIRATVNSDDPAYFGGYVGDNYAAISKRLPLGENDLVRLASNSFESSFLDREAKTRYLVALNQAVW